MNGESWNNERLGPRDRERVKSPFPPVMQGERVDTWRTLRFAVVLMILIAALTVLWWATYY
jgi:hypothetical protein